MVSCASRDTLPDPYNVQQDINLMSYLLVLCGCFTYPGFYRHMVSLGTDSWTEAQPTALAVSWICPQASLTALPGSPWAPLLPGVGTPDTVISAWILHSMDDFLSFGKWVRWHHMTRDRKHSWGLEWISCVTVVSRYWHALRFLFLQKAHASEVVCFILYFRHAGRWYKSHLNLLESAL